MSVSGRCGHRRVTTNTPGCEFLLFALCVYSTQAPKTHSPHRDDHVNIPCCFMYLYSGCKSREGKHNWLLQYQTINNMFRYPLMYAALAASLHQWISQQLMLIEVYACQLIKFVACSIRRPKLEKSCLYTF